MSYLFEIDGVAVWSPALRVGHIYVGYVKVHEQAFGISAGFTAVSGDRVVIDPVLFTSFVHALVDASVRAEFHAVSKAELNPVLGPSLVMLQRSGRSIEDAVQPADILAATRRFAQAMPR